MIQNNFNGVLITFDRKDNDVMINATEMAKAFGKNCSDWLRTEQSKRMIDAIATSKKCEVADLVSITNGGNSGNGTWMHEDVALVFAQWLSPEFYIWCNDRIKELLTQGTTSLPQDYLSALKELVAKEEERQRLAIENKELKPKADYYDALVDRKCLLNFTDTAKELKIGRTALINILLENKWIYRNNGKDLRPYAKYVEKGYFEMKEFHNENRSNTQTLITVAGRDAIMNKLLTVKLLK